jgi:hypothetical protein
MNSPNVEHKAAFLIEGRQFAARIPHEGSRPGGRAVGCYRVAPAVPGDHRQREGAGVRPEYRRVDAAASAVAHGDAAASPQGQLAKHRTARVPGGGKRPVY